MEKLAPLFTWRSVIASTDGPSSPTTRLVLLTLSLHMSERGESCFPSTDTLAEETGLTKRSVITHLLTAQDDGWIIRKVKGTNGQGWKRHEYLATIPTPSRKERPSKQIQPEKGGEPLSPRSGKLSIRGEPLSPRSDLIPVIPYNGTVKGGEPLSPRSNGRGEPLSPRSQKKVVKDVHSSSSGLPEQVPKKETCRPNGLDDDTRPVWEYYVQQYGKLVSDKGADRLVPTKKRISKVRARMGEGYSEDELKRAIDGVLNSEFHRENGFTDLELICRDQGKVEQYLARVKNGSNSKKDYWERELPIL